MLLFCFSVSMKTAFLPASMLSVKDFATPGGSKGDILAILPLAVRDGGGSKCVIQIIPSLSLFTHK